MMICRVAAQLKSKLLHVSVWVNMQFSIFEKWKMIPEFTKPTVAALGRMRTRCKAAIEKTN